MDYAEDILGTIGNTPMVRLARLARDAKGLVLAKLEMFNPGGSVKDRIGIAMVEDAEEKGLLRPGGTIIEPTSGNTGIGLALVAALKGYKMIFTVPDKQSREKINMLKAYGARVVVTPTAVPPDHPDSYYRVADRLHEETSNSFVPNQYYNQNNPLAHYRTTGPEIWEQTDGKVTHFVAGMGTGGTISGVGKFLKEKNPEVRVIGADPYGSILAERFRGDKEAPAYTYKVEGIGEDFLPETTHYEYVDDVVKVTDKESFLVARRLAREEGILAGGSSGSAVAVALRTAASLRKDDVLVVLIPESGDRYLGKVHSDEWMREHGFLEEARAPILEMLDRKEGMALPRVLTVTVDDTVADAIALMARTSVSQLPVTREGKVAGSVREDSLMAKLVSNPELGTAKIQEVMEPPFPIVEPNADLGDVAHLLRRGTPAVLVARGKDLQGIVTRIDVIQYLAGRGKS